MYPNYRATMRASGFQRFDSLAMDNNCRNACRQVRSILRILLLFFIVHFHLYCSWHFEVISQPLFIYTGCTDFKETHFENYMRSTLSKTIILDKTIGLGNLLITIYYII